MDEKQTVGQPANNPKTSVVHRCHISAVYPRDRKTNLHIRSVTSINRPAAGLDSPNLPLEKPLSPVQVDKTVTGVTVPELKEDSGKPQAGADQKKLYQLASLPEVLKPKVSDSSLDIGTDSACTDPNNRARRATGRLVITPEHQLGLQTKVSSSDQSGTWSEGKQQSRPSLSWGKRVSMNTPIRRASEHEVGWVESPELPSSMSTSSESDDNEQMQPRTSVLINLDEKGRKVSISLAQVDRDIQDYLAEIPDDVENATQSSTRSTAKSNEIANDLISSQG